MEFLLAGLLLGAVGTFHCIGMCGPLALSLPVVNNTPSSRFVSTLLYNIGRVVTYSTLGAAFGLTGLGFAFFGYQQILSISLGVIIIFYLLIPAHYFSTAQKSSTFLINVRRSLGQLFTKKTYGSVFTIGILNGLLPCGMIYMAMAAAVSSGSILQSSLFMAMFGLGTLPVMWSLSFFGGLITIKRRSAIRKLFPVIMFVMAVLLILRGLSLDIPYLSPAVKQNSNNLVNNIECHD